MISPLFTTIVLLSAFIFIYTKITLKDVGKSTSDLLEKELQANSVRRQSLSGLDYIQFSASSIPVIDNTSSERIARLYSTLASLYDKQIVNLTGITNTDLKLTYGPANLQLLSEYDQNFTILSRAIYDLGVALLEENYTDEAISVLNYGISIGTDISGNYILLANIYVEQNNYSAISQLIEKAASIKSLTRISTIDKLQEILDTHTTMVIPHESPIDASASTTASVSSDDSILPKDILDMLETVPYSNSDQS